MDALVQTVVLVLLLPRPTLSDVALLWVLLVTVAVLTRDNNQPP